LRRLGGILAAAAIASALPQLAPGAPSAGCPATRLTFDAVPPGVDWPERTTYGSWHSVHDGFGATRVERTALGRRLWLSPRPAADDSETFSSLVRSVRSFGDADLTVTFETLAQLRRPRPNPWEVAWAIWRYQDNDHFYYFIVKPNGWELGKEDPAYRGNQRFLASSSAMRFPIGRWYRLRVRHVGNEITVWIDGREVVRFSDRQRPYSSGAVGLYVEDARAVFGPVGISRC
jgi:Domain of Unknown Function (DUF1080)